MALLDTLLATVPDDKAGRAKPLREQCLTKLKALQKREILPPPRESK